MPKRHRFFLFYVYLCFVDLLICVALVVRDSFGFLNQPISFLFVPMLLLLNDVILKYNLTFFHVLFLFIIKKSVIFAEIFITINF